MRLQFAAVRTGRVSQNASYFVRPFSCSRHRLHLNSVFADRFTLDRLVKATAFSVDSEAQDLNPVHTARRNATRQFCRVGFWRCELAIRTAGGCAFEVCCTSFIEQLACRRCLLQTFTSVSRSIDFVADWSKRRHVIFTIIEC